MRTGSEERPAPVQPHTTLGPARSASAQVVGWASTAAVATALLLMLGVSAAGPSAVVPAMPPAWPAPPWWVPLHLPAPAAEAPIWAAVVLGAAGVCGGVLAVRRGARPRVRLLLTASFAAVAAFAVLPPAGSSDSLSYAAYGRIVVTGHNPYVMTPAQLRASGDPIGMETTRNWLDVPSVYGPLATAGQWGAAELGGGSISRVVWWLKLLFGLAFCGVTLLLDRLLRTQPAARLRAHLLWSLNPLMLWAVMAGTHTDTLAAALGVAGLALCRGTRRPASATGPRNSGGADVGRGRLDAGRALAAGLLVGAAAAVKIQFALFLAGVGWVSRRSPPALAAAALGAVQVLGTGYLLVGPAALADLRSASRHVTWDSLWRVFIGFGSAVPSWLAPAALLAGTAMAVLLAWRLPPGNPALPAVRPALAVLLAWLLLWPTQRAWYDVAAYCLLAVSPATRLDWVVLARSVPATLDLVSAANPAAAATAAAATRAGPARLVSVSMPQATLSNTLSHSLSLVVPGARLAAALAVVVLCLTGSWGPWLEEVHPTAATTRAGNQAGGGDPPPA